MPPAGYPAFLQYLQSGRVSHFLPSLVLVRAPMGQPEPELLVLNDALFPHNITPKHSIRFSFVEPVGSNNRLSLPDEQSDKLILAEIG